jgi:Na+/H+-dicarboxylate symporter
MHLAPLQLAAGVLVAVVVSLSAISLPGQASFASTQIPVMLAMGVPIEIAGLLLALDTIPDAFRTAANVTGDLAVTAVVARRARDTAPAPAASVELAPIAGAAEPGRSP